MAKEIYINLMETGDYHIYIDRARDLVIDVDDGEDHSIAFVYSDDLVELWTRLTKYLLNNDLMFKE